MQYYPLLQESQKYKTLTAEETFIMFDLYKKGNKSYKELIYKHNLKLIFYVLTHYNLTPDNYEEASDLIMELSIKLWDLIDKFDPHKGVRFNSFAGFCLRNKAISLLKKNATYHKYFVYGSSSAAPKDGEEVS